MIKSIKDIDFLNKIVLIRCDFNLPIDQNGVVSDIFRLKESKQTIEKVINDGGVAILMSHTEEGKSLEPLVPLIEELLDRKVFFIKNLKINQKINKGDIFLLENLRFFEEEKKNDDVFAEKISSLGDIYINEAFSVSHRNHASVSAITKFIPSYGGFNLLKEIEVLSRVKSDPWRPLVSIIGGAKVSSKIKSIEVFLDKSDHLLLGGKAANEILVIKGVSLNRPWPKQEIVDSVNKIDLTSPKIHYPVDTIISPMNDSFYKRIDAPGNLRHDEDIYDIGPETIKIYSEIIKSAKMIIWSGPLGFFEKKEFEDGTREIAKAISLNHKAFKIIGGGDTAMAIKKFNLIDSIDHISTGGGAMLSFLGEGELPGLKALGYYE